MQRMVMVALVVGLSTRAHADPSGDVTKAVAAFVQDIVDKKPINVDLFVVPGDDDDDPGVPPVPTSFDDTRKMIASAKLKVTKVIVSKSGKSAWLAGEVPGTVIRKNKPKSEALRLSAFATSDDKGWHVRAFDLSAGEPDSRTDMCGMLDPWRLQPSIPAAAKDVAKIVIAGLGENYNPMQDTLSGSFVKILSDDKNSVLVGSAPKELFTGGAKIKSLFKKWRIHGPGDEENVRAGIAPDGELAWVAMSVYAPPEFCAAYRSFSVVAKEAAGWRIVHQHYSRSPNPY